MATVLLGPDNSTSVFSYTIGGRGANFSTETADQAFSRMVGEIGGTVVFTGDAGVRADQSVMIDTPVILESGVSQKFKSTFGYTDNPTLHFYSTNSIVTGPGNDTISYKGSTIWKNHSWNAEIPLDYAATNRDVPGAVAININSAGGDSAFRNFKYAKSASGYCTYAQHRGANNSIGDVGSSYPWEYAVATKVERGRMTIVVSTYGAATTCPRNINIELWSGKDYRSNSDSSTDSNWNLEYNQVTLASNIIPISTQGNYELVLTTNASPNAPISNSPVGTSAAPAIVRTLTPVLSWTPNDPDANDRQTAYQAQVFNPAVSTTVPVFDSGEVSTSATTLALPSNVLQPNTTYYWTVRTEDTLGYSSPTSSPQYFKTSQAPTLTSLTPGNPNATTPSGSSVNPRLSWTYSDAESDPQKSYQVRVYNASTNLIAYDSQVVNAATAYHDVATGALGAGIKFYWTVTVTDATGMSTTSAPQYILTNNPPAALTLMSPVDTYRTTTRPVFVANIGDDVENDKQNFKIQIAEDSNFTVNLQEKITTTVTGWEVYNGTSWVAMPAGGVDSTYESKQVRYTWQADLPEGKKYYWRMAPIDGSTGTAGAWSATRSVRIGNVLQFKLKAPVQTTVAAKKIVLTSNRKIPTDGTTPATFKVEVCNNGLDAAPTWEDATSAMLNGSTYSFVNTTKTGTAFAVDCRITINTNDSLGPIECDGLGFSFS